MGWLRSEADWFGGSLSLAPAHRRSTGSHEVRDLGSTGCVPVSGSSWHPYLLPLRLGAQGNRGQRTCEDGGLDRLCSDWNSEVRMRMEGKAYR